MDTGPRLTLPLLGNWDWQTQAACRGMEPAVFFYSPDEPAAVTREAQAKRAKSVCARCPVADACLEHALLAREPYGVWGGRSEAERAELLGVRSLRYPARRSRPRTRSAASRREVWRASTVIRGSDVGTEPVDHAPAADAPDRRPPALSEKGSTRHA